MLDLTAPEQDNFWGKKIKLLKDVWTAMEGPSKSFASDDGEKF